MCTFHHPSKASRPPAQLTSGKNQTHCPEHPRAAEHTPPEVRPLKNGFKV